jgi:hypothetical protein
MVPKGVCALVTDTSLTSNASGPAVGGVEMAPGDAYTVVDFAYSPVAGAADSLPLGDVSVYAGDGGLAYGGNGGTSIKLVGP